VLKNPELTVYLVSTSIKQQLYPRLGFDLLIFCA